MRTRPGHRIFALTTALLAACGGGSTAGDARPGGGDGATSADAGGNDSGTPGGDGGLDAAGGDAGGARDAGGAGNDAGSRDGGNSGNDGGGNDGNDGGALGATAFHRGVNPGYYGPGIDRRESAQLSARAGANSLRTTLPEYYLNRWGDSIEVPDYAYYPTLGVDQHVIFLVGPSAEHSNAPAGTPDWQLDHYSPRNLYQPIFLADGTVNPENYWAAYVERVARLYGDHLELYEVWNEPDQVGGNWQATQGWATSPPNPADLIWWNDTVYAYVRALRIAYEVVHRVDPTARVTVGGVGYPNFLRAVLRYTDEPTAGAVTSEYPHTGASYLDALSYHYYPVFGGGSSDRGVDGFLSARDEMRAALDEAGVGQIPFAVTESGAPRYALGGSPGGEAYASAYLVKMMTLAHDQGFDRVDWFAQGDGAVPGASTDPFQYMGLYEYYGSASTVDEVQMAAQGRAYAWLATWLEGTAADSAALAALGLPDTVRGAAFAKAGGGQLYVLWARTSGDESATASYALPASGPVQVRTFDPANGERVNTAAPANGAVALALTGMPTVVEAP